VYARPDRVDEARAAMLSPPQMSGTFGAISHLVHYVGFTMGVGASFAAAKAHAMASQHPAGPKAGMEAAAADIIAKVELPGLFLAVFGGILHLVNFPNHLKPALSGAGPWLHIKLLLVLALLVVAHLRMFRSKRLVRERAAGATEADCEALLGKARMLGKVDLALAVAVIGFATFRYVLFA
jgi:uncharacterized membrane protein